MTDSKKMQGRLGRFGAFSAFVPSSLLPHHASRGNAKAQKLSRFSRPVARFLMILSFIFTRLRTSSSILGGRAVRY